MDTDSQYNVEQDQHTVSTADQHNVSMATTTETEAKTAAALTADQGDGVGQQQGQVAKILSHTGDGNHPSGSGPPWGQIPHQGGGGGNPSGGRGGGGGGGGGGNPQGHGAARGAPPGGGNGKLGGNPPSEFNGDRAQADMFLNEFNLYRITNVNVEQMTNPMKHAALFLGFVDKYMSALSGSNELKDYGP